MNSDTMEFPTKKHIGRNIRKIREYMGVKQEAIAIDLGIHQQEVSKIEQQEEVEDELLEKIAESLGVTPQVIKNFDLEQAIYNINHFKDNTFNEGASGVLQHGAIQYFNPLEKVIELYERLLQSEKEKIELLTKK